MVSMKEQVEVPDLNEELTRLWDREQGQNKIRASLFTLILYVPKNEKFDLYQSLFKKVLSKFPCRVMLILNDPNPAEEYLRTSVSSETLGEGEKQIYCEIIRIEVAGKLSERVPYIILPQILPDLPIYLLWLQDPSKESEILRQLEPIADRTIFDAESTQDLQNYCRANLSLMHRFHCAIGDLKWSSLSGWRTIFSQVFYDPDSVLSLAQAKIIRIYYNNSKGPFPQQNSLGAAYLQAWLASRMSWKFQTIEAIEGNIRITYRKPVNEVVFLLTPQEVESLPPGAIVAVEIESLRNKGHYSFKRHPKSRQVVIQYSEKDHCDLPYATHLSGASSGQEIVEELFYPSGGTQYRDMLDLLSVIPWRNE